MSHVLEVDSIQLLINGRKILSDVYVRCNTGKIIGLLGKNGEGKSCLMKAIYGIMPCEKSVRFDHMSIVESYKRPGLIRYLPQFNFIPKALSIRRVFQDFELAFSGFQNMFCEFVSLDNTRVGDLSGGERRVIEVYVTVMSESQFVLLDEPFTQLNPLQIEKVKMLLTKEKARKGMLITDHMYKHIIEICDSLYVLTNGQTHLTQTVSDIERLGYAKL